MGSIQTCQSCGTTMTGDGQQPIEHFECPKCGDRWYTDPNGVLLYDTPKVERTCINCQQELAGSEMTAEWEDGDNADAYITCRHCGAKNPF